MKIKYVLSGLLSFCSRLCGYFISKYQLLYYLIIANLLSKIHRNLIFNNPQMCSIIRHSLWAGNSRSWDSKDSAWPKVLSLCEGRIWVYIIGSFSNWWSQPLIRRIAIDKWVLWSCNSGETNNTWTLLSFITLYSHSNPTNLWLYDFPLDSFTIT